MNIKPIPVNEPHFGGNEKKYLNECIDSGWISSEGPFVSQFEEKLAHRVNRKYGIAVSSGSSALEIAVKAIDLEKGDEVILPTFTIISCASAIIRAGATPVVVDSDPLTWNINVNSIEKKITPRTKAIMVVHIFGLPVDMDYILSLAKKYKLKIIEDAAEVIGLNYRGKPCGSFGDVSIFSFYPNKHITTGEGGMVVTNNVSIADRCKSLRNLCFQPNKRFVHEEMGWNMRMSNLQAAIGVAQLERLDKTILRKREIGDMYQELLKDIDGLELPLKETDYAKNIYWVFGVILNESIPYDAKEIISRLKQKQIGSRPFFWPMHEQPIFLEKKLFINEKHHVAERIARRGLYLPSGLAITNQQIETVSSTLQSIFNS